MFVKKESNWLCRVRSLLESFPFAVLTCTYLLLEPADEIMSTNFHVFALCSLVVSVATIVSTLVMFDGESIPIVDGAERQVDTAVKLSNCAFRICSVCSRVVIISFFIALFDWWVLVLLLVVPVVGYSGQYM